MPKQALLDRLGTAHPGWDEYDALIDLVKSLPFERVQIEYVGDFIASGSRLVFSALDPDITWENWLPNYASALYGMKSDNCEMEGGYAWRFCNELVLQGAAFSPAGNDQELGFPIIPIPDQTYAFQANSSGAPFFINTSLEVLYPSVSSKSFEVLDSLENFTKTNIRQVLKSERWFSAYADSIRGTLMD